MKEIKVVFVGGDERQKKVFERVRTAPDVRIVPIQPCWNKNWNKSLKRVERVAVDADAIVLSTDVPTLLGKSVRSLAREAGLTCRAGRARGRGAIEALAEEAATDVRSRRRRGSSS